MSYENSLRSFRIIAEPSNVVRSCVRSSQTAADTLRDLWSDDISVFESFYILTLDRANNVIGSSKISQGGISGTVADVRLIAFIAINTLASGVILAHNHPSGQLRPSEADLQLTKKIQNALTLLDVQVLDHIILCPSGYYSFVDDGKL